MTHGNGNHSFSTARRWGPFGFGIAETMTRASFRNILFLLLLGIPVAACTHRVNLYDPITYGAGEKEGSRVAQAGFGEPQPIPEERIRLVIRKAKDLRLDISKIGNAGFFEPVEVKKGVVLSEVFTKNLMSCFELAGYEVISLDPLEAASPVDREKVNAWIEAEIMRFWVELRVSDQTLRQVLNLREAESEVMFRIRIYGPDRKREIWRQIFEGKGNSSRAFQSLERSINSAYAEAMRDFCKAIADQKTRDILQK
jgi:hypothetical protein